MLPLQKHLMQRVKVDLHVASLYRRMRDLFFKVGTFALIYSHNFCNILFGCVICFSRGFAHTYSLCVCIQYKEVYTELKRTTTATEFEFDRGCVGMCAEIGYP